MALAQSVTGLKTDTEISAKPLSRRSRVRHQRTLSRYTVRHRTFRDGFSEIYAALKHFAEVVTTPDFKIPKTYLVKTSTRLSDEQIGQLQKGVILNDGPTQPAIVKRVRDSAKYSFIEIIIREGRNRQVRRMIEAVGSKVLKLVRTEIGSVRIGDLPIGKYRELTVEEVRQLTPVRKRDVRTGSYTDYRGK